MIYVTVAPDSTKKVNGKVRKVMRFRRLGLLSMLLFLSACTGLPKGIEPLQPFELSRYTGSWYEIARLDHSFERGLSRVSANYTLNDDGQVRVLNRGFNAESGEWQEAEGVARFSDDSQTAHLEVSFFGPFYSSYVVFDMPEPYQLAYVAGFNRDYLWLLSRSPTVSDEVKQHFVARAEKLGFNVSEIIWVEQGLPSK